MPYEIPHKNERVVIPVTPKDRKLWRRAARAAGVTLAEYGRQAISEKVAATGIKPTNGEKADA